MMFPNSVNSNFVSQIEKIPILRSRKGVISGAAICSNFVTDARTATTV